MSLRRERNTSAGRVAADIEHLASYQHDAATARPPGAPVADGSRVDEASVIEELRRELQQRERERDALARADAVLYGSLRLEDIVAALFDVAAELLGAEQAVVWTWDAGRAGWVATAARGIDLGHLTGAQAPDDWVVRTTFEEQGLAVMDAVADPRLPATLRPALARAGIRAFLNAPIRVGEDTFGVFAIAYSVPRSIRDGDRRLLDQLAQRAGLAIKNARVYARETQHLRELEALYRADEALLGSLRLDDVLQAVVDVAMDLLAADKASLLIWDAQHESLVPGAVRGFSPESVALMRHLAGEGITGRVAATGEVIAVADAATDPRVAHHITDPEGIRSLLHAPIKVAGTVFGVFGVNYCQPRQFTGEEERLLLALAQRAALAIDNARLFARAEERARELEALYRADGDLHRSLRLQEVLQTLVDLPVEVGQAEMVSLLLWDESQRRFVVGGVRGLSDVILSETFTLSEARIDHSSSDLVEVTNAETDARISARFRQTTSREGVRAWISSPIRVGGKLFGSFSFGYGHPHTFSERERRLLVALAQRAAIAIQNARLYEQAQQAAALEERHRLARELHDAVTQTLFSASVLAEVTPKLWDRNPDEGRRRLEEIRQLTRGALAEMRSLLLELRPSALTEVGLDLLVRQLGEAMASRTRLRVDLTVAGAARPIPADTQVTLYRLAQEALNNVVKHARAESVTIHLGWLPEAIRLVIEDDGRGFDPSATRPGHLGLAIMRERAASAGASVSVASQPGHGTRVQIDWPSPEADA